MSKTSIITISAILIMGLSAAAVYAWGCGGMYGYNNAMHGNYNAGYYNNESYQSFINDTHDLRASIAADRAELNALMAGANPDAKHARQLSEQISRSESQLMTKAREYNISGMGGSGMGMMGYGQGWTCGIAGHNHDFDWCR